MSWIYQQTASGSYIVGTVFIEEYADGQTRRKWITDSSHSDKQCAARRVSYLNGGSDDRFTPTCGCFPYKELPDL